jgi:hypothetical protein
VDEPVAHEVEAQLVAHPRFGDSDRILRRVAARYEFELDILAERLPGVAASQTALAATADGRWSPALRDPVVRAELERALRRLEDDRLGTPDELEDVLVIAADRLVEAPDLMPIQTEEGAGLSVGHTEDIWVVGTAEQPGPLMRRLQQIVLGDFLTFNERTGQVRAADSDTVARLDRAAALLCALLPRLGPSVMRHVAAICMIDASADSTRFLSASGGDLGPGVVVVNPAELADPWQAAGMLLHEALHLKLFDAARCFGLIAEPEATTPIPWRQVGWDLRRVLYAFHVYAHLAVFQTAIDTRGVALAGEYGTPGAYVTASRGTDEQYADAAARARYLGGQLAGPLRAQLTPEGRQMVQWLLRTTAPMLGIDPPRAADRPAATPTPERPVAPYAKTPGLRTRALPELECLLAFAPTTRTLCSLNLTAWVAFELCDGRADLDARFQSVVASKLPPAAASRQLRLALTQLEANGLVTVRKGGETDG